MSNFLISNVFCVAIITMSLPPAISLWWRRIDSLSIRRILFRSIAFFDIFLLTGNANREQSRWLRATYRTKKGCVILLPFLNAASMSGFLDSRYFFASILYSQFLPFFSSPALQHLPSARRFFSLQKTVCSFPFSVFYFCKTHITINNDMTLRIWPLD